MKYKNIRAPYIIFVFWERMHYRKWRSQLVNFSVKEGVQNAKIFISLSFILSRIIFVVFHCLLFTLSFIFSLFKSLMIILFTGITRNLNCKIKPN